MDSRVHQFAVSMQRGALVLPPYQVESLLLESIADVGTPGWPCGTQLQKSAPIWLAALIVKDTNLVHLRESAFSQIEPQHTT